MNHAAALSAVDDLFTGRGRRLPELRAHLDGCLECRAHYDRTARAFRALSGKPEEMTAEELSLFAPMFPEQAPAQARWPMIWLAGLATAAAAALVVYVQFEPSEFNARGSTPVAEHSSARALCSHDNVVAEACTNGDRLAFVATARGQRFIAVALVDEDNKVELVVSGADGALSADEAVLPNTSTWRPGLRAVGIYGDAPIAASLAEKCARGDCPPPFERREIPLGRP